jgi:hypothetical protein
VSRRRKVSPEVEEVRRIVSVMEGRARWPKKLTVELVHRLRADGLIPAAIADELALSDRYVRAVLQEIVSAV